MVFVLVCTSSGGTKAGESWRKPYGNDISPGFPSKCQWDTKYHDIPLGCFPVYQKPHSQPYHKHSGLNAYVRKGGSESQKKKIKPEMGNNMTEQYVFALYCWL